ncbi:MAG: phage holin family protein [Pirellulales bacterium]|nr:phage holin family protein [Pirellulales bacterium]
MAERTVVRPIMSQPSDSLFSGVAAQADRLRHDFSEMLAARLELARLEATAAARQTARCAVALAVATLLLVSILPIAVATLALAGANYFAQSPIAWLAGSVPILGALAAFIAWLSLRHYRRHFTGMRDTLAELREDLVWLQEWSGQADRADAAAPDADAGPSA